MKEKYRIVFQPSGRRGEVLCGMTALQAAQALGVGIKAACGGSMMCGKCRVIVEEGRFEKLGIISSASHLSPRTEAEEKLFSKEELTRGYRLACDLRIKGDVVLTVPEESRSSGEVILEAGRERAFSLRPSVKQYPLLLSPASLEDARDDRRRLLDALEEAGCSRIEVDYPVLQTLPRILREKDGAVTVTVWKGHEVIRVAAGDAPHSLGMAVDVGTTTVAAFLCDLVTGELLAQGSCMNPQIGYGEDVIARISFAMAEKDGLGKLQRAAVDALGKLAEELTGAAGRAPSDVDEMVLVSNTAMHHLMIGIDPRYVGRAPFVAGVADALDIKARDLAVPINPSANIHLLPIEAGFVGADNVAVLLAEAVNKSDAVRLIIDIGTNGEINLLGAGRILSASCATGPALEGAQISFGMRAAEGAIERVVVDAATHEPRYKVIGQETWYPDVCFTGARGICGSGVIDAVSELFAAGVITKEGRIRADLATLRVRENERGRLEYVLAWASETAIHKDIVITQADIRAVQLAKAALYAGAKCLMQRLGVPRVDEVILAGAFGSFVNKKSALALGLFPDCDLKRVYAVGNAAGDGARMALLDVRKRNEAQKIARRVEFVETATEPGFQSGFMDAIAIPHARDAFPHAKT